MKIYNTLTNRLETFTPLHEGTVNMYVCGPTVYNYIQIGNARPVIFFDVVRRFFDYIGYNVNFVSNITDVDDKIITRAIELEQTERDIAERFIKAFYEDVERVGSSSDYLAPRVTEYMDAIIGYIEKLLEKDYAYHHDGDVYFRVGKIADYGILSGRKLEELLVGARVEINRKKENPLDFTLWKKTTDGVKYPSPWGEGRPGWHTECVAMIEEIFGGQIDIHGGGADLIFPHHENEIAQSEGCTGQQFVKYWMHNNMVNFGDQKMSKSLGNVVTGRSFLEKYNAEILKFLMLSAHYRSPVDLSEAQVLRSVGGLARIYSSLTWAEKLLKVQADLVPLPEKFQQAIDAAEEGITQALNDDFNTPEVLARIFEVVRLFNQQCRTPGKPRPEHRAMAEVFFHWLKDKGSVMALFQESPGDFLNLLDDMLLEQKGLERSKIDELVQRRFAAREQKDYATSDELRKTLEDMGISVQDTAEGSLWEVHK